MNMFQLRIEMAVQIGGPSQMPYLQFITKHEFVRYFVRFSISENNKKNGYWIRTIRRLAENR